MACRKLPTLVVIAVVVMSWTASTHAQKTPPQMPCIQSLFPCADFLNSTKPPVTCCAPLAAAVNTQLQCLCDLFHNQALTATMNVNVTQALQLPKNCGIGDDPITLCSKASKTPTAVPKAHAPEAASAPAAAPSLPMPAPPPGSGAASIPPISGLLVFLVGFMFC